MYSSKFRVDNGISFYFIYEVKTAFSLALSIGVPEGWERIQLYDKVLVAPGSKEYDAVSKQFLLTTIDYGILNV